MSGCAVGPDGKLLDAQDIQWYDDADSSEPINHMVQPTPPTTTAITDVPDARRSGRTIRPSNRMIDPNNAEASTATTPHKRKASGTVAAGRRVNRKVVIDTDESSNASESDEEHSATTPEDDAGDTEPGEPEDEPEDAELAHASTKAMGDADRKVSSTTKKHDMN
jgi:hypothetical protein